MSTQLEQTEKGPISKKMRGLAKVEIGKTDISNAEYTPMISSTNEYTLQQSHLMLKPLSHFEYQPDTNSYVLNINVHLGNGYSIDPNNAVQSLTTGKNILIFLNYAKAAEAGNIPTSILNYRIEFDQNKTDKIKGKRILVVTSSGDPEEGSTGQVVVEDEDEI